MATARLLHASRLSAAELDSRVTIQSRLTAVDERGQEANAWTAGTTMWARVRPTSGREYVAANAVQSQNNVVFTTRYIASLYTPTPQTGDMRILWKGAPYDVIEPPSDVDGGHYALEFVCSGGRPGVALVPAAPALAAQDYTVDATYFAADYLVGSLAPGAVTTQTQTYAADPTYFAADYVSGP